VDEVVALGRQDVDDAAWALARAFHEDPFFAWLWPDPGARAPRVRWLLRLELELGRRGGGAVRSSDPGGAAVWFPPGRLPGLMDVVRTGFLAAPLRMGVGPFARFTRVHGRMARTQETHAPEPHWYLMSIGVDPERQGHGLGSGLVRFGLSRADAAGVPCYLENSNEGNLPFYEHHGFRVLEAATLGRDGPKEWIMRREPAPCHDPAV